MDRRSNADIRVKNINCESVLSVSTLISILITCLVISNMSQITHSFDKNNNHKRVTNIFSSTPITSSIIKHSNISLSNIGTGSSSSEEISQEIYSFKSRNLQLLKRDLANKHKRYSKKRKRSDTKWRMKDSDSEGKAKQIKLINQSLNEKRKKNLESKKKTIKRKLIVTQTKDKDMETEWETESEKLINDVSIGSQVVTLKDDELIKLFEDPCTPEKIRDAQRTYEEILPESPIIMSFRKRSHLISKNNDISLQNELLPVNLLSSEIRNPEEAIKNETIFDYEGIEKAHVPLQRLEQNSKQFENFSFPNLEFPATNFRRNQRVKTYSKKNSQNLAFKLGDWSFELSPIKLNSFISTLPKSSRNKKSLSGMICFFESRYKNDKKRKTYSSSSSSQEEFKNDERKTKTSKRNMKNQKKKMVPQKELKNDKHETKTRKRNMKNQKKKMIASQSTLKQKYSPYDNVIDERDIEFETGGRDGKRVSFCEFRQKRNRQ